MAKAPQSDDLLDRARDALFFVVHRAHALADAVEQLEAVYAKVKDPNPDYFYVPSTANTGRELSEPTGEDDRIPRRERKPRRNAIDAALSLRAAIDTAIASVTGIANYMDSPYESAPRQWTTRTVGELRKLRGAILSGHARDIFPSALPMIQAGVPGALRDQSNRVARRMEEVKTTILAGVALRPVPTAGSSGPEVWVSSTEASKASGLSTEAIRKKAQLRGWPTKRVGSRRLAYRLIDLKSEWPDREFRLARKPGA